MQDLIRGTTPSLIVDFSDTEVSVTDITQAVLVITQAGKSRNVFLADLLVDAEANTISYHFTQSESLALSSGKGLDLQMDVVANGERYRAYKRRITVEDTKYNEVL